MISASHNPPAYSIKIFDHNGQKLTKVVKIKFKN